MKFSSSAHVNNLLYQMGMMSYYNVINKIPSHYEDYSLSDENHLEDKKRVVLFGHIEGNITLSRHNRLAIVRFLFISANGNLFSVTAFNRPYLAKTLKPGESYTLVGIYKKKMNTISMINIVKGEILKDNCYRAIYSLPHDISNYQFQRLVIKGFSELKGKIYDIVPNYFRVKYKLLSKEDSLKLIHFPKSPADVYQGYRSLKYEECLLFALKTKLIREENINLTFENKKDINISYMEEFINKLPYKLTNDQKVATKEIINDMNKKNLMYRLLQGDVGTGKTLVAILALYANYLRNEQGALMAPTDTLARQHFDTLNKIFADEKDLHIALLLGSTSKDERMSIINGLEQGVIDIVIGTHALFSKDVIYSNLGLAIIDEQHRFGVNQRMLLASKGNHADLLLMSATPIPRTLALTLYGDLNISTICEFPNDKRSITTKVLKSSSTMIDRAINKALIENSSVYVVAPLITSLEEDDTSIEEIYKEYKQKYGDKVAVLHGKMKSEEKSQIIKAFQNKQFNILVSTSVIEVGVDIKSANLMIIYDATHFGLASLHQLRGRIGRNGNKSLCLLISDDEDEDKKEKLKILETTLDGFKIAEADLAMRGPGEMEGLRQSGLPHFSYANIINDIKIFECARDDATFILKENSPGFQYIIKKAREDAEELKLFNA